MLGSAFSDADAFESPMLLEVTPKMSLVHQVVLWCNYFCSLLSGALFEVSGYLFMSSHENFHIRHKDYTKHLHSISNNSKRVQSF